MNKDIQKPEFRSEILDDTLSVNETSCKPNSLKV